MKKIITSVGVIVFVAALVAGGTGAFFSDTETSTGNVFAAGAIDLQIDNSSYGFDWNDPAVNDPTGEWGPNENNSWQLSDLTDQLFFNFADLKPGDYGEDTISLHVHNNDAWACMAFDLTGTPENGQNEPEAEADQTAGENEGELQNYLSFLFWYDDGDNVLEDGEELIDGLNGLSGDIFSGEWLAIADSNDDPLPGDSTNYIGKGWCFGDIAADPVTPDDYGAPTADNTGFTCSGAEGDHNDAQTDGITVDVAFYAVQSRNNADFSCASLPPIGDPEPEGPFVGAALGDYTAAPEACTTTVSGSESIQGAIDAAADNSTVCVADTYDATGDDVVIRVNDGIDLVALSQGEVLDVPVSIDSNDVVVKGFAPTMGQIESPAEIAAIYVNAGLTGFEILSNTIAGPGPGGNVRGIVIETGAAASGLIEGNVISNFTTGITLNTASNMTIQFNDIDGNTAGIAYDGGANVGTTNIVNNDFSGNTENMGFNAPNETVNLNINNFPTGQVNNYVAASTLDAEDNWWGGDGPVGQIEISGAGLVDADPEASGVYTHN